MTVEKCVKPSFSVIGKEGSTAEGSGFIQRLWEDANAHFGEIEHLAKRDESGNLCGVWGTMTDLSRSFKPWQNNFSEGLYLAGLECERSLIAPHTARKLPTAGQSGKFPHLSILLSSAEAWTRSPR